MAGRLWKSSPAMAAATFLVFPVAVIPLIRNWNDDESDIKVPFFLALASVAYTVYSLMSYAGMQQEEQDALLSVARLFA
jgi:hypothetical protein